MMFYIVNYNGSSKGQSGENIASNKYDLSSACVRCGTGAKLIGSLYVKGINKVNLDFFETINGDVIISEKLYDFLILSKIKLPKLFKVKDKNENGLAFYYLNPDLSFPKSLPESDGLIIDDQCVLCKKDGYYNDVVIGDLEKGIDTFVKPINLYFNYNQSLFSQSDVFNSWEHFGKSNLVNEGNLVIRYARPLLLCSEKFKNVISQFKVKNVEFEELKFV